MLTLRRAAAALAVVVAALFLGATVTSAGPDDPPVNPTAECAVGDALYWPITNEFDTSVDATWEPAGGIASAPIPAAANDRTYFTSANEWGVDTTTIGYTDPVTQDERSTTTSPNNSQCVYDVEFAKVWYGAAAPDLDGVVLFTAESSIGSAECTSDDGLLSCSYTLGGAAADDLSVPFGETYSVTEVDVDGWITTTGTGANFAGIVGFDEQALPDELVYLPADDRFCVNDGQQLEKYCTHTVTNLANEPEPEPTTPATEPPVAPAEPEIEITALAPICIGDFPYVEYSIAGDGLEADATVTLNFIYAGEVVETYENQPLSGEVLYPGTSVEPPDWPGWVETETNMWEPDPSDAAWRNGLQVEAVVNPMATGFVSYPAPGSGCETPRGVLGSGDTTITTLPAPTIPPGQGLPETGSSSTSIALIALALLGGGFGLIALSRRGAPR